MKLYELRLSYYCGCPGALRVGDLHKREHFHNIANINSAYQLAEHYNKTHCGRGGNDGCGCQVEVFEVKE